MIKLGLFNAFLIYICIQFSSWLLVPVTIRGPMLTIVGIGLFITVVYGWFAPIDDIDSD